MLFSTLVVETGLYDVLQPTKTNKESRKKPLSVMYLPVVVMLCFSHIDLRSSTHFSHFTTASLNFCRSVPRKEYFLLFSTCNFWDCSFFVFFANCSSEISFLRCSILVASVCWFFNTFTYLIGTHLKFTKRMFLKK